MPYFRAFQLFWLRLPYLWIQSLSWWISIVTYFDIQVNPYWNRTLTYHFLNSKGVNHGWTLGGACYIHLTMRTNAVFSGYSASLVSATIFMNPITLVMNYLYFLFWHHRRHCWNRTPSLSLFLSNGSNHGWTLGGPRYIHLTKGTNAVFSGFSATLASAAISMNPITKWWISIVS